MGIPLPGRTDTEAPRQRLKPEVLRLLPAVDPLQRHRIEAYVAGRFLLEHGAQLTRFLPMLYGLVDAAGQLQGALGLRSAAEDTLFLERYLPQRVDRMMGRLIGHAPARSELVEVGNLAANGRGSARALIVLLTQELESLGLRWVTFTGTTALVNSFRRLGIEPHALGLADPLCLDEEERQAWGHYYDCGPQVMAVSVEQARAQLQRLRLWPAQVVERSDVH